jgi:N-acyl homoserine lactone hydrolase
MVQAGLGAVNSSGSGSCGCLTLLPAMRLDDVQPIQYGDVLVEGERWPGYIHVVEHPQGRVLVDTGLIDSTPELDEEWSPRFDPDAIPRDVICVINTHLHFDHCGGNRLFAGMPIYVQRVEREAARAEDYTIPEWVDFDGVTYVELDGEQELLPGLRVVPTPGHTPGHQSVLVETDGGLVVVAGDVAYTWDEFDAPGNESAVLLTSLAPSRIWLAHESRPR